LQSTEKQKRRITFLDDDVWLDIRSEFPFERMSADSRVIFSPEVIPITRRVNRSNDFASQIFISASLSLGISPFFIQISDTGSAS